MEHDTEEKGARDFAEPGALVVEPEQKGEGDRFPNEVERTLHDTEAAVVQAGVLKTEPEVEGWTRARQVVSNFKPVPWFIWRLSNFVLGSAGHVNPVSEGLVFGLRRLLFAAASDPVLGCGAKVTNVRKALEVLPPDVIAAISVIHAVSRRLSTYELERIWRPILDDAVVRARIGFIVGANVPEFGRGRCMLAGFAGRCGLAIQIASGDVEGARRALEMLAVGGDIQAVGREIYGCDPLQISAMTLSASGCGRDAAFGTVNYAASRQQQNLSLNQEQRRWLAAFTIAEYVRTGRQNEVDPSLWSAFSLSPDTAPREFAEELKLIVRRGHGWSWLV